MNNVQLLEALLSSLNNGQAPTGASAPAYIPPAPQPASFLPSSGTTTSSSTEPPPSAAGGPFPPSLPSNNNAALLQNLLMSATSSQGRNLLSGLDPGTQALALKALLQQAQPQLGAPAPPPPAPPPPPPPVAPARSPVVVPHPASTTTTSSATGASSGKQLIKNAQNLVAQHLRSQKDAGAGGASSVPFSGHTATPPQTNVAALLAARGLPSVTTPAYAYPPSVVSTTSSKSTSVPPPPPAESVDDISNIKEEKKRAANRISAQRCRRRKREFFEELKEENDELRKLNQLLAVIPDLIISFDASGIMRFVSKSSTEFLGETSEKLVGTSFWRLLCANSARRLKSIFMDSMAKRSEKSNSVPLGDRSSTWNVRLKDQNDPNGPSLALRGTLYFTEGSPQCVCTIRQKEAGSGTTQAMSTKHLLWRDHDDRQPSEDSFVSSSEDS